MDKSLEWRACWCSLIYQSGEFFAITGKVSI